MASPRPGSDVDVPVVEVMTRLVERRPVQEAVDPVEVEEAPELDAAEPGGEEQGLLPRVEVGQHPVGVGPGHQHLVRGPDRAAAGAAPEDVVAKLAPPEELALCRRHPVACVLVPESLRLQGPQPQVPGADDGCQHQLVAREHLEDPVRPELDAAGERRLEVDPGKCGDPHVDEVPGEEVPREAEQPPECLGRFQRPGEPGIGRGRPPFRLPEPARVAGHAVDRLQLFFFRRSPSSRYPDAFAPRQIGSPNPGAFNPRIWYGSQSSCSPYTGRSRRSETPA